MESDAKTRATALLADLDPTGLPAERRDELVILEIAGDEASNRLALASLAGDIGLWRAQALLGHDSGELEANRDR